MGGTNGESESREYQLMADPSNYSTSICGVDGSILASVLSL